MNSIEPVLERVRQLAENICEKEGIRLYDLEFISGSRGKGRVLRVFLDQNRSGSGVSLEECAIVSRGLSTLLDESDAIPGGEYDLEVSSPGLERPLRELWHFQAVVGSKIEIRTINPLDSIWPNLDDMKNRSKITARLAGLEGETLVLDHDGRELKLPISCVSKCHRIFEFNNETSKPNKKK